MKAIRWIQNVAAVVAIAMAVSLAVVMLLGPALEEERRAE